MNGIELDEKKKKDRILGILYDNRHVPKLDLFATYLGTKVSLETKANYLLHVVRFVNYCYEECGVEYLRDISMIHYLGYKSKNEDKTASYQNVIHCALKNYSKFLYMTKITEADEMKDIESPRQRESVATIKKREKGYLTEEEIKTYLAAIENGKRKDWIIRDKALFILLITTGLRESAVFRLDIDSVDFENNTLTTLEKGGKVKKVLLMQTTADALKEWVEDRNKKLSRAERKCDALFISNTLCRFSKQGIVHTISKYGEAIEGKTITPHRLRGTFGTQLYNKSGDIFLVSKALNHSSTVPTQRYIRNNDMEFNKRANALLEDLFD